MPRLALTVRLKTSRSVPLSKKTEKTSVVAPPMSTPTAAMRSALARDWIISPTAPGVGMIGTSWAMAISFL